MEYNSLYLILNSLSVRRKESLYCDSQAFHQYQQSKQPPLTLSYWTQNNTMTFDIGKPELGLGQAQPCGGLLCLSMFILVLIGCAWIK